MIKKKKYATKKGKWSAEYKVKVSVNPVKRKKKGAWGTTEKQHAFCSKCEKYHTRGGDEFKSHYDRLVDFSHSTRKPTGKPQWFKDAKKRKFRRE